MKRITAILTLMLAVCAGAYAQNEVTEEAEAIEEYNKIMDIIEDASKAQEIASAEFPYSKVLYATDQDLKAQRFKYNAYHNSWTLSRNNGWNVVASILSDVYTPVKEDYIISIQNGEGGQRSSIQVTFFDPEIYHTILAFANEKGSDYAEGKFGKGTRYTFNYAGYKLTLEYTFEEVKVTRTTTGSNSDNRISTSRSTTDDFSYDKYVYTISTGVPAESDYLKEKAAKNARREEKGKKARSSEAFL